MVKLCGTVNRQRQSLLPAGGGVGDLLGDEDDWSQGDCPLLPRHHHGPAFPAVTQLAVITPPGSSILELETKVKRRFAKISQ